MEKRELYSYSYNAPGLSYQWLFEVKQALRKCGINREKEREKEQTCQLVMCIHSLHIVRFSCHFPYPAYQVQLLLLLALPECGIAYSCF